MKWIIAIGMLMLIACSAQETTEINHPELEQELKEKLESRIQNYTIAYKLSTSDTTRSPYQHHTWPVNDANELTHMHVNNGNITELLRYKQWSKGTACNGGCLHTTINYIEELNKSTKEICRTIKDIATSVMGAGPNNKVASGCRKRQEQDIDTYLKDFLQDKWEKHNWTIISKTHNQKYGECYTAQAEEVNNTICFQRYSYFLRHVDWRHSTYYEPIYGHRDRKRTQTLKYERVGRWFA